MKMYPLALGGFSYLESAEVPFWFVDSYRKNEEIEKNPKTMQKRYMAVKREARPLGKNLHELRVLTEIRNGVSSLLPKYYIPMNIPGFDINQNPIIMMDFLSDGSLGEYLKKRKRTVSLLTKVNLLFAASMALKYLESYKIVHLDVKPNNFMISPGLLVKIIDFGESFHP